MAAAQLPAELVTSFKNVSDQGNKYDTEDSPSDQYYGFLAEIEQFEDEKTKDTLASVQFELVPLEWMESSVLNLKDTLQSQPPTSPATFFVFDDAPLDTIANSLSTTVDNLSEGQWFIITLGRGKVSGSRASPSRPFRSRKTKAFGRVPPSGSLIKLSRRFRPRGRFDNQRIKKILGDLLCQEVGVMDVGQASCNLVYSNAGVPQLYIDVGLPMFPNFASLPPVDPVTGNVLVLNPGPCLLNNPPGILTHWHWDHYTMGNFSTNHAAVCNRDWIVPNQPFGGAGNNFWNAVPIGNRHVMPAALPAAIAGNVNIIQCVAGPGIPPAGFNNSGLAVVVTVDTVNNRRVLFPGDAAFQSIPGLAGIANLRWMPASHHGSDTNLIPLPPALPPIPPPNVANQGRLAYSYGITAIVPVVPGPPANHCYNHPNPPAVAAYIAAGWGAVGNVASTAETGPNSNLPGRGNIMMCNNNLPPVHPNCPFHAFPKILV